MKKISVFLLGLFLIVISLAILYYMLSIVSCTPEQIEDFENVIEQVEEAEEYLKRNNTYNFGGFYKVEDGFERYASSTELLFDDLKDDYIYIGRNYNIAILPYGCSDILMKEDEGTYTILCDTENYDYEVQPERQHTIGVAQFDEDVIFYSISVYDYIYRDLIGITTVEFIAVKDHDITRSVRPFG